MAEKEKERKTRIRKTTVEKLAELEQKQLDLARRKAKIDREKEVIDNKIKEIRQKAVFDVVRKQASKDNAFATSLNQALHAAGIGDMMQEKGAPAAPAAPRPRGRPAKAKG